MTETSLLSFERLHGITPLGGAVPFGPQRSFRPASPPSATEKGFRGVIGSRSHEIPTSKPDGRRTASVHREIPAALADEQKPP